MRTTGGLMSLMLDRENLVRAATLAARGRREQPCVRAYFGRLEEELRDLRAELACGQPRCGECRSFTIYDPKERLITAPVFHERVLHHAVMAVCGPVLDRRLTHHSYACRMGKGTLAALEAAQQAARRADWFVKMDVRRYFDSIPRERLLARLARVFREQRVLQIFSVLAHGYEPGSRGLTIGTLVSQHLANFYLAALDTFVLQEWKPRGMVRYMDDVAVWVDSALEGRAVRSGMEEFATVELGLEFKPGYLNRTGHGMDFLGHRVFPHRLGLCRRSRRRYRRKLAGLYRAWEAGEFPEEKVQERGMSLTAFTSFARCIAWRRSVIQSLGEQPQTSPGCSAAGAGSTTASTASPPTATGTTRRTATTTSASGLSQLQQEPCTGGTGGSSGPFHRERQNPKLLPPVRSPQEPPGGGRARAAGADIFSYPL